MGFIYKYRTCGIDDRIEREICVRETKTAVFILENDQTIRLNKEGKYQQFHNSWQEAMDFLIARAQQEQDMHTRLASYARQRVELLKTRKEGS